MSSSSAYEPDEDSNSASGPESNHTRVSRSSSQVAPSRARSPLIKTSVPPEDHRIVIDLVDSGSEDEDVGDKPVSPQNRSERAGAIFKTLRTSCVESYSALLAEMENETKVNKVNDNEEPYAVTQNGAVIWTATEKEMLFHVLDRKGKNGIRDIAAAIGTKSELEVMDYIKLLQRGLEGQHILERQLKTIILGDVSAAAEISQECCAELDIYAHALVMKEDSAIMQESRKKFSGNNGVLTEIEARKLLTQDEESQGNFNLPAGLLKLPTWIRLSQELFMNFGGSREQESWSHHAQPEDESPVIYGETFMDFYALAMSLTKRLVQSSIFFAMARLRDTEQTGRERSQLVRKKDVRAAMDILNLKPLPQNHFLGIARQHRLAIADDELNPGTQLSYEEAEEILNAEDENEDTGSEESDTDPVITSSSETPNNKQQEPSKSQDRYPLPADPEDEHADFQDREQSRQEEVRLWRLLAKPGPVELSIPVIAEEEKEAAARKVPAGRKTREDLIDWRERTLYRSEWEEYGAGLQDVVDELDENRRKRRRLEYETDTDTDAEGGEKQPVFLSADVVNSEDDESGEDGGGDGNALDVTKRPTEVITERPERTTSSTEDSSSSSSSDTSSGTDGDAMDLDA